MKKIRMILGFILMYLGAWIQGMRYCLLFIITGLLLTSKASGQEPCTPSNYLSIGGGIGFSNKNALAHVQVGYKFYKGWGIDGSMIAHMDNINPAMFNGQLLKSFYMGNKRLTLLGGISYQITTFDKTGGTKTLPIVGLEWARIMTYHDAVVYVRGQVTGDNFCLMVGLSGLFKSKN